MNIDFDAIRKNITAKIDESYAKASNDSPHNKWHEGTHAQRLDTLDMIVKCLEQYHDMLLQEIQSHVPKQ